MKNLYILLFYFSVCNLSSGQILAFDNFSYPDGPLVGNGAWAATYGSSNTIPVISGEVLIDMDGLSPSAGTNLSFSSVSGDIFYSLDFTVTDVISMVGGADRETFAYLFDATAMLAGWRARIDVVSPTASGDYSIGISTGSNAADTVWPNDLTVGVTYNAIVRYNQIEDIAELWINASSQSDPSILGTDGLTPLTMVAFGLRQSNSQINETVLVDNVLVSSSFNEILRINESIIKDFKLFPNPANRNSQSVYITSKHNGSKNVEVFNVLGEKLFTTVIQGEELNISRLTEGLYVLKITENNITITRKLVVN
ncbi:T9SS type A sorting domain-containing protein [Winogradskyella sp. DF17]|uniref:T9SS type A sorting domain-containing protein n=1 Tax=Winogradskyella pelagia TaxID=2819984 RepID=A0ABS3T2J1_9FLAO|nr:T9SS type A sorting domain-containing protein [Winogradskyella sp. DF17]MBO3116969.1 T9SS type A sorting domain-containing protein [Winogradskyella sp. DF17]